MAENIKRSLEVSIPVSEVETETERVIGSLREKVRLPGFRPGKVPTEIIRKRFSDDIRQKVVEELVPKHFWKRAKDEGLNVVGRPDISDVHFHEGEPLRFKAEFEVAPDIELKDYKELIVPYQDPEITDEDVSKRIEELREQKAEYVNIDPRPVEDGDFAVVSLESLSGVQPPVKQDEVSLHVGDPETLEAFSENLRGMTPGEEKEFSVTYPEEFGQEKLAGKTIRFRASLKVIRRKELPEVSDDFARDLGDFQNLDELRDAVRKSLFLERQFIAQQKAKDQLVDKLVDMHEFPVPEAFIERQVELQVEGHLRNLAAEGVDPRKVKIDWPKVLESQRERAIHDVKASLLLDKIGERENLFATNEELDREVQRIAKQQREPVAATRIKLEKEDGLRRIASRIRSEKILNFLFEHARKTAE